MPAAIPSVLQLERAIRIAQKIQRLNAELEGIVGQSGLALVRERDESAPRFTGKRKYTFSEATLAKRAAMKAAAETAEPTADLGSESLPKKSTRKTQMSEEGRAAIVNAQKARWAKVKGASQE